MDDDRGPEDHVFIRHHYVVRGRFKGQPIRSHTVSDAVPVAVKQALGDAPLVATVTRDAAEGDAKAYVKRHGLHFQAPVPDQVFEYRLVEGRLMRRMVGPDCVTPLRLEHLPDCLDAAWRDHPAPLPTGSNGIGETVDRETSGIKDLEQDGREDSLARFAAESSELRSVEGVLYRPCLPPAWALSAVGVYLGENGKSADHVRLLASAPDYDVPPLRGAVVNDRAYHGDMLMFADPRIRYDDLRECLNALTVENTESENLDAVSSIRLTGADLPVDECALAEASLLLLAKQLDRTMYDVKWKDVHPSVWKLLGSLGQTLADVTRKDAPSAIKGACGVAERILPLTRDGTIGKELTAKRLRLAAYGLRGAISCEADLAARNDDFAGFAP